ncbi:MAG: hypothetical protein AB1650_05495 [Candidatus Omnitrophota bacterium]
MKNTFEKSRVFLGQNACAVLVIFVYLYIFGFVLTSANSWMHPEAFGFKQEIVRRDIGKTPGSFKYALNYDIFEHEPRITRPLSSVFEILDTHFRVWLWKFIPPHPSLSLTWFFTFIFSPILLYGLLKNFGLSGNIRFAAIALFLMNPGILSYSAMLFRPAKAMTNFSILLCLYSASILRKQLPDNQAGTGKKFSERAACLALMFLILVSFFWDETALLVFPAIMVFFPSLFKDRHCVLMFIAIPFLAVIFYFRIIPWLTVAAGYPFPNMLEYTALNLPAHEAFSRFFRDFSINGRLLFFDSLGLATVSSQAPPHVKIFMTLNAVSLIAIAVLIAAGFIKKEGGQGKRALAMNMLSAAGIFLFLFSFHGALMAISRHFWGIYWYGAYFPVFFVIAVARIIPCLEISKVFLYIALSLVLIDLGLIFPETNEFYKKMHFYPKAPVFINHLFIGDIRRFDPVTKSKYSRDELKEYLERFWVSASHDEKILLPKELYWVLIEVTRGRCQPRHGAFMIDADSIVCEKGG